MKPLPKQNLRHSALSVACAIAVLAQLSLFSPSLTRADDSNPAGAFYEIQQLYTSGAYHAAILKSRQFELKFSTDGRLAQIHNLHGLSLLLTKNPNSAIDEFEHSLEKSSDTQFQQYVLYNLASAYADSGEFAKALSSVQKISPSSLDTDGQVKLAALQARCQKALGRLNDAASTLLRWGTYSRPNPSDHVVESELRLIVSEITSENEIALLKSTFARSRLAFALNEWKPKAVTAQGVNPSQPSLQSPLAPAIFGTEHSGDAKTIGVLLPLTGKYKNIGERALHAIQMALGIYAHTADKPLAAGAKQELPDLGFTLVIEDSGDDGVSASAALERMATPQPGFSPPIAVIGPVSSKGIELVVKKAESIHMPLITLCQNPGPKSAYVVAAGLTPSAQTNRLAEYSMQDLGQKRFAIVYPRDKFGEMYAHAFWNSIEALGGQITGIESYAPGETDFRVVIDKLAGLHYLEARSRELQELAKQRELQNIKKRTRKTESYFALKPIVDFDAVFIPEDTKIAGQIIPMFAYRDVDNVNFLGTATWDTPDLISRVQGFTNHIFLTDAWSPTDSDKGSQFFDSEMRQQFDVDPGGGEALAYDAASWIAKSIVASERKVGEQSREKFLQSLLEGLPFHGITGEIENSSGTIKKTVTLLTIKDGGFVKLSKKPSPLTAPKQ